MNTIKYLLVMLIMLLPFSLFSQVSSNGSGIYLKTTEAVVNNSIVFGNKDKENTAINVSNTEGVINYTAVEGTAPIGTGNATVQASDFINATDSNFQLASTSALRGKGNAASVPTGLAQDLNGFVRTIGNITDMGAYQTKAQTTLSWNTAAGSWEVDTCTVTYNSNKHEVQATVNPTQAGTVTVTYYKENETTALPEASKNAGRYDIKAELANNDNYEPATPITGKLIINKATATLSWNTSTGTWNSNNECTVTYNGNKHEVQATVTPTVAGTVTVTYYKEGETTALPEVPKNAGRYDIKAELANTANYKTVEPITGKLIIISPSAELENIQVNNTNVTFTGNSINYTLPCGAPQSIPVQLSLPTGASVQGVSGASFDLNIPLFGGTLSKTFTIKSQDSSTTKSYTLTVTRPLNMDSIATELWNNTLMLELNKLKAHNITPTAYQWYKDSVAITGSNKSFYSAGDERTHTLQGNYSVELTLADGSKLRSCGKTFTANKALQVKVYPNPVKVGEKLTIEVEDNSWEGAQLEIYNSQGQRVCKIVYTNQQVTTPSTVGIYMIRLVNNNGEKKEFKIIIN